MCTPVHCVECDRIRSWDPVLYGKIQGRENLYSGIFYAVVSDSRTVGIIYFTIKISSLQILFDTVQLLFSFAKLSSVHLFYAVIDKIKNYLIFSCNNIRINKHSNS